MENLNIELDTADYKTILSHQGKIDGLVGSCKIDELTNQFDEVFRNSLLNAKGISVKFTFHPNHPLSFVGEYLENFYNFSNEESDVILGTEVDDSIDIDTINYEILITGLCEPFS